MSPQLAEAFARLPAYLGGHVAVSVTALLLGLAISLPLALARHAPPGAAQRAARRRQRRADHSEPGAAGAVLSAAARPRGACANALFGAGFSALGFLPSVLALTLYSHAAGAAEHHHRIERRRSRHQRGRARRRHDAAAIAHHGRAAAGAAGDHGRHPHRRDLGDRRRHAVDADRPDVASATTSSPDCKRRTGCSCCSAASPRRCSRSRSINCWR